MKPIKKVIFGVESLALNKAEKEFFAATNPLGFILFKRNVQDPTQLKALVNELYEITENPYLHVLIDQEGGRVARLKPPLFRAAKPAGDFAKLALHNLEKAKQAVFLNHYLIGKELAEYKINVNCAPVADLLIEGAHSIIGDRSFGSNPKIVIELCNAAISGLHASGVISIIKHIPGHGRANDDSHKKLPYINEDIAILEKTDFAVFSALRFAPWAMTAHIIYEALDPLKPVTQSEIAISYIRNDLGFANILVSDDLNMDALNGTLASRASKSIEAGCDAVLHCKGTLEEYASVASVVGDVDEPLLRRIKTAYKITQPEQVSMAANDCDIPVIGKELAQLENELTDLMSA